MEGMGTRSRELWKNPKRKVEPLSIRIDGDRKNVHNKKGSGVVNESKRGKIEKNNCPHTRVKRDRVHKDTQTPCGRAKGIDQR